MEGGRNVLAAGLLVCAGRRFRFRLGRKSASHGGGLDEGGDLSGLSIVDSVPRCLTGT